MLFFLTIVRKNSFAIMEKKKQIILSFGPQHPILPEPIKLKLLCDEEKVTEVIPIMGYVHRGIEEVAASLPYSQFLHITERTCGICSFIHSLGFSLAVEKAMGIESPARAKFLRIVWSELLRIHSHLLWLSLFADAMGFESLFMQGFKSRESVVNILERTTGNRVIYSVCLPGGVKRDIDEKEMTNIKKVLINLQKELKIMESAFFSANVKSRTKNKGVLTKDQAQSLGAVGPVLRASGVSSDLRATDYLPYSEIGFKIISESETPAPKSLARGQGDAFSRMFIRIKELWHSIDLILKVFEIMPAGEIMVSLEGKLPKGEATSRVEAPRGELRYFIKAEKEGSENLQKVEIRTPTFANIPSLFKMLPGCQIADVPIIILSIDPCISCAER